MDTKTFILTIKTKIKSDLQASVLKIQNDSVNERPPKLTLSIFFACPLQTVRAEDADASQVKCMACTQTEEHQTSSSISGVVARTAIFSRSSLSEPIVATIYYDNKRFPFVVMQQLCVGRHMVEAVNFTQEMLGHMSAG